MITFSPHTTFNLKTQLVFKSSSEITTDKPAEFPEVPDTEANRRAIRKIIESVICTDEAAYFLREVDPEIDGARNYAEVVAKPMDLPHIRAKAIQNSYAKFSDFTDDMRLVVSNACLYYPVGDKRYVSAVKLSYYFRRILDNILRGNDPNLFITANSAEADEKIARTHEELQNMRKQRQTAKKKREAARPKRTVERDTETTNNIIAGIRRLEKQGSLMGVVEIITRKEFSYDNVPCTLDFDTCDDDVFINLQEYIESMKDKRDEKNMYAWRPILSQDLQEIRDEYRNSPMLSSWKKAPDV